MVQLYLKSTASRGLRESDSMVVPSLDDLPSLAAPVPTKSMSYGVICPRYTHVRIERK